MRLLSSENVELDQSIVGVTTTVSQSNFDK